MCIRDRKNGTLRWENLTRGTSHFFYEQAEGQSQDGADTLEVIRYDANTGAATTLVPYKQTVTVGTKTLEYSVVVQLPALAFRDTTFVRNSGNFRRAAYGEGGPVQGTRAMTFDVTRGFQTSVTLIDGTVMTLPIPVHDLGISQAADV